MFAAVTPILILLAATAIYVRADPDPNSPAPGDVLIQGSTCTTGWNVDPTGLWKTMNIDLMTGDNFNMVFLTTVGTVDGTSPSQNSFSFPCPQVTPHSPIYFFQFSSPAATNKTWTGRFTIADSVNDIVAPSQSTQPDGQKIPWGIGSLVNASLVASVTTSGTNGTLSIPSTSSSPPSVTPTSPSNASTSTAVPVTTDVVVATPSTVSTPGTNGAVASLSVSNIVFQTGLAFGLTAFAFTIMF